MPGAGIEHGLEAGGAHVDDEDVFHKSLFVNERSVGPSLCFVEQGHVFLDHVLHVTDFLPADLREVDLIA